MNSKTIISLFVTAAVFIGCTFSKTYTNRESDKKDAVKVIDNFYILIKKKEFDSIYLLLNKAQEGIAPEQRKKLVSEQIKSIDQKLGTIDTLVLEDCKTKRVEGSRHYGEYIATYKVTRIGKQFRDSFKLILEDNTKIKIAAYDIKPLAESVVNGGIK